MVPFGRTGTGEPYGNLLTAGGVPRSEIVALHTSVWSAAMQVARSSAWDRAARRRYGNGKPRSGPDRT